MKIRPRRRLIAAAVALVAIAAGVLGVGTLAAQAQPNALTIDLVDGSNIVGPYTVQGSIEWSNTAGGTVEVSVTGPSGTTAYCTGTAYPATATSWACPAASLEYGSNTVLVTATETDDPGNPLTTSVTVTRGSTQPATITTPTNGAGGASATVAFAGAGPHMGTVTLQARLTPAGAWADLCTAVAVGEDGLWNCGATFPGDGDYDVQALGTLLGGLDGGDSAIQGYSVVSFSVDTPVDGATIDWNPGGTEFTGSTSITEPATATVFDAGAESTLCATAIVAGSWACTSANPLLMGTRLYSASVTTVSAQYYVGFGLTVRPGEPGYTTGDPTITEGGQVTFEGTTTAPDVVVTVAIDYVGSCSPLDGAVIATVGTPWSCAIDDVPTTAPGEYAVDISQTHNPTGTAGATRTATLTIDPAPGVEISAPVAGAQITWMDGNFFVISGTAPGSNVVDVYLDDDLDTPVCSTTPDTSWTCDGILIDPGAHTLTAEQEGETGDTVAFEVLLPEPGLTGPYAYAPGTTDATITGTVTYADAWTHVSVREDFGEGWGGTELAGADCPMGTAATFTCVVDLSALAAGSYIILAEHYLPADNEVRGAVAESYLYIESSLSLDCEFAPSAVTITPDGPASIGIYTMLPRTDDAGWSLAPQGYCGGSAGYRDDSVPSWDYTPLGGGEGSEDCDTGCALTDLAPGIYEVYYSGTSGGSEGDGSFDYLFRIPEAPAVTAAASSTSEVALSGSATALDRVTILSGSGGTLCQTTASASGAWACAFPRSSATTARALSLDPQSGGMSALSSSVSIPVYIAPPVLPNLPTEAVTPSPPTAPTGPTIVTWFLEAGDLMNLKPGDTFTIRLTGIPEGWSVEVIMHSTPHSLGTTTSTGEPISMTLTVPDDIESGAHRIEVAATTPLGTAYFQNADARVFGGVTPSSEEDPTPDEEPSGDGSGSGGGAVDRTDPGAPSGISGTLAPFSVIAANPATIAIAGGLALALLFLVALPTELLNSSLSSNTSRLGRAYGAVDGAMTKAQDWLIRVTRSRAAAAAILVVIIAIIYGFVDPGFGFDIVSLRLVLSLAIAFFLLSFVASWISGMIIRRAWGAMGVVAMQPSIILFAIVGVIVARILDFSPGFLVGIAIGLELLQASKTVTAKAVFVQLGVVTGLSLAAWVVYSVFTPGNDFAGMLLEDTLVATTAEGLTGALIAVFPLKFLDGRELWEVSKRLWVAAFLIVSTAFALLVLPTAIAGTDVADYGIWLLVFAVFGAVSLAVWIIFVRADAKAAKAESASIDA